MIDQNPDFLAAKCVSLFLCLVRGCTANENGCRPYLLPEMKNDNLFGWLRSCLDELELVISPTSWALYASEVTIS